jgi:GTPase SAR1 family protein
MGNCGSGMSAEEAAQLKLSREVEKNMQDAYQKEQEKIKLLLLGAGESGKSTIFKQMRVLYGAPLSEEEKRQITPVVYSNIITSMKCLCENCTALGYEGDVKAENKGNFDMLMAADDNGEIDPVLGTAIKALWTDDPGIQLTWKRRSEYQIVESVKAYFNEIDRIMADDYVSTQQDMLLARVRTSGIVTEKYIIDGTPFEMYDVGGQRNERKKWIHCFDDVTAVIFVAALSEYDQMLFEDATTNRMDEAVGLFQEICNNRYFQSSSMILFLNKRDLFEDKIKIVGIADQPSFADFPCQLGDPKYYDMGVNYFLTKFLAVNENEERIVYHHVTCATDSQNVQVVFNACKDIILRGNLKDSGFMD